MNGFFRQESSSAYSRFAIYKIASALLCFTMLCFYAMNASAANIVTDPRTFDHMQTGFVLTGSHSILECEDCHVGGVYESLPTQCSACHDNVLAQGTTPDHIVTALDCDACHTTEVFLITMKQEVDHSLFGSQACIICHNGVNAEGKGSNHIASTDVCEACHVNRGWIPPSNVDHSQVLGSCYSCHDGVQATGKSASHIASTNDCEFCHGLDAGITWKTTQIDHSQVFGACSSCHNGVIATGKGPTHVQTNLECNNCHTTLNWIVSADLETRYYG